jgi:Family of unknown function (DUF6152)
MPTEVSAMRATRAAAIVFVASAGLLTVAALPAAAHHSFAAEYDSTKPITLHGAVVRVEWTNPHARFYVEVKDPDGKASTWNLELASPNVLVRQGWTRQSLRIGDEITVSGSMAKDGSKMANAREVTLASGKRVFAGSAGTPESEPAK